MRRFILDKKEIGDTEAIITGPLYRHMVKVLRMKPGADVILADGEGGEYKGIVESIDATSLRIKVSEQKPTGNENPGPKITIYQGLPKGGKLDYIIQKCTELGVTAMVPFAASRSIVRMSNERKAERVERWQKIAVEAARQSRRTKAPQISFAADLYHLLKKADHTVKLLLWEEEKANLLRETLAGLPVPDDVGVLIGPEGGFSSDEVAAASSAGFIPVSLGRRVVRTETAGVMILAILQFYWGDLG